MLHHYSLAISYLLDTDYNAKYMQVTWSGSADTGGINPHKGDEEDLYMQWEKVKTLKPERIV